MKKQLPLQMIFWCIALTMQAQSYTLEDSIAILNFTVEAQKRAYTDQDSALLFIEQAIKRSQKVAYLSALGRSYLLQGDIYRVHDGYQKALEAYKTSIRIYEDLQNREKAGEIYNRIGLINFAHGKTQKALDNYQIAIKIAEETGDSLSMGHTLINMGSCYAKFGENSKVLSHFLEATALFKALGETSDWGMGNHYIAQIYHLIEDSPKAVKYILKAEHIIKNDTASRKYLFNLGYVYLTKGEIYGEIEDSIAQLMEIGTKMIEIGSELSIPTIEGKGYYCKSSVYKHYEQYDSALVYAQKSYAILKKNSFQDILSDRALSLGQIHLQLGQLTEAEKYLSESLEIEKKDTGNLNRLSEVYFYLSKVFEKKKNYQQAHYYLEQHRINKDSLFAKEKEGLVEEVEAKYQVKEQEAQLLLKENQIARQRLINTAIGILSFLLLIFGIYAYQTARQRKKSNTLLQTQSEQLQSLDRAKSRFFANISHELRTPLTLVIAPLDNALQRVKNQFVKEDLQLASSNSKKLLTLVNEILDLTKLENGQMQLLSSNVHLEALLHRILFSYHSLADLKEFTLRFDYLLAPKTVVSIDVSKLEKILNNLLSNAFKYSLPGGVISLKIEEAGKNNMSIEVSDQGKGIDKEELARIFDRFYQVEGSISSLQGGTGIGLSLAKELAEVMGGTLSVKSELGKGSNFKLILPLNKVAGKMILAESPKKTEAIEETSTPYIPGNLHKHSSRLLIVEDKPEMSNFLEQVLSPYYHCTTASDGVKALKLLNTNQYDLITSDVMMPNMDGFSFLEAVRKMPNCRSTPFILLTARSLEADRLRGLHLGVDDYITKPFSTSELLARINNLLHNKQQREAWHQQEQKKEDPKNPPVLSAEKELIKKAETFVLKNIDQAGYRVEELAKDMAYSRRQLARIIQKLTGFTPVEFIREIRLLKAYSMLENRQYLTVSEVRYEVGFENASYFTKVFVKRFGVKPSEVL